MPADRNLQETFVFISGEMIVPGVLTPLALALESFSGCRPPDDLLDRKTGGAYRDRTDDPLLAKQVLSQLS